MFSFIITLGMYRGKIYFSIHFLSGSRSFFLTLIRSCGGSPDGIEWDIAWRSLCSGIEIEEPFTRPPSSNKISLRIARLPAIKLVLHIEVVTNFHNARMVGGGVTLPLSERRKWAHCHLGKRQCFRMSNVTFLN